MKNHHMACDVFENTSFAVKKDEEYQEVCNTSEKTSSRDIAELISSGLFEQIGNKYDRNCRAKFPIN